MIYFVPITAAYASLLAVLILILSYLVTVHRRRQKVALGQGDEAMARAIRVHANAVEYIPIALILILLLELNNAQSWLLHGLGSALTTARILHAWGLSRHSGVSFGRVFGTLVTWLVLLFSAAANLAVFIG